MKNMLPLILVCSLLCGCTQADFPEETTPTTVPVVTEIPPSEAKAGSLQKMPLNLSKVRGLCAFGDRLLLFSGQDTTKLTLVDSRTLEQTATAELSFPLASQAIRFQPQEKISFVEPNTGDTLVLDENLRELRRIPIPGGVSGEPILDGNILYYCTVSHLRAWDLDTGIRRCIKEMAYENQMLTDVLMDGTVLQCTVTENAETSTLFFSAEDGQTLHHGLGRYQITTRGNRYWAQVPAGYNRLLIFGEIPKDTKLLTPKDMYADVYYLPDADALISVSATEDSRVQLHLYCLSQGTLQAGLTLDPNLTPLEITSVGQQVFLLTYDARTEQTALLRWIPLRSGGGEYCSGDYRNRDLSPLARQIQKLEERYAIRILIGREAAVPEYDGYTFEPETVPILIQQELTHLEQWLAQYPEEILRQTADHFGSLSLRIVRSIRTGSEPLPQLQYLENGHANLVIALGPSSEQAFYHGLFHLMETHILSTSKAFDNWNTLNPAGFRYDYDYDTNACRDSGVYLFEDHRAFVDTFSMSFPREDRARIMEYAMLPNQKDLFRSAAMQGKLSAVCAGIRDAYDMQDFTGTFPWEQYLD